MFYKHNTNVIFKYGKFEYEKAIQAAQICSFFTLDKDEDEFVTATEISSCYNCLFRRWTQDSFTCMKKDL